MSQLSVHLVLVATLLGCPFRCFSHTAVEFAAINAPAVSCICCGMCDSEIDASEVPFDRSGEDCDCQNCICKGAIIQNDRECLTIEIVDEGLFIAAVEGRRSSESSITHYWKCVRFSAGRYLKGRDARILHQSFLI